MYAGKGETKNEKVEKKDDTQMGLEITSRTQQCPYISQKLELGLGRKLYLPPLESPEFFLQSILNIGIVYFTRQSGVTLSAVKACIWFQCLCLNQLFVQKYQYYVSLLQSQTLDFDHKI